MESTSEIFDVEITETAWEQMVDHARFLANVSHDAANRLVDEFINKTGTLNQMPERCPWLKNDAIPEKKYRKLLLGKYHLAIFVIRGNKVYVTAVVDCRQDYSWLL